MRRNWRLAAGAMGVLCGALTLWLALAGAKSPEQKIDPEVWRQIIDGIEKRGGNQATSGTLALELPEPDSGPSIIGNSFRSVYDAPTPTPTPTPRPSAPPDISVMGKRYSISGMVSQTLFMQDTRTKEDLMLRVGEKLSIENRGQKFDVILKNLDTKKFEATFEHEGQEYVLGMLF